MRQQKEKQQMIQRPQKLSLFILIIGLQFLFTSLVALADESPAQENTSMKITSSAFHNNEFIPPQFTGDGKDVSPPLAWTNIPEGTRSLALLCDDPDSPSGNWVHWILYNIPPTLDHINEGGKNLPPTVLVGKNSWGKVAYTGPNPPRDAHHYHFTLYALNTVLNLKEGATKEQLTKAMEGHIYEEVTLTGLYERKN